MIIFGKNINLRLTEENDAEFIVKLRSKRGEFLSKSSVDVEEQIKWIKKYKEREVKKLEYYFVIESKNGDSRFGVVRIYDIKEDSFCWGSWIIKDGSPFSSSIESALLVYDFCFFELKFKKTEFDVRRSNEKIVAFHKRFGAKIISEDDINYYFNFTKESYIEVRKKYKK